MQANSSITLYNTFTYYDTGNLYTSTGLSTSSKLFWTNNDVRLWLRILRKFFCHGDQ